MDKLQMNWFLAVSTPAPSLVKVTCSGSPRPDKVHIPGPSFARRRSRTPEIPDLPHDLARVVHIPRRPDMRATSPRQRVSKSLSPAAPSPGRTRPQEPLRRTLLDEEDRGSGLPLMRPELDDLMQGAFAVVALHAAPALKQALRRNQAPESRTSSKSQPEARSSSKNKMEMRVESLTAGSDSTPVARAFPVGADSAEANRKSITLPIVSLKVDRETGHVPKTRPPSPTSRSPRSSSGLRSSRRTRCPGWETHEDDDAPPELAGAPSPVAAEAPKIRSQTQRYSVHISEEAERGASSKSHFFERPPPRASRSLIDFGLVAEELEYLAALRAQQEQQHFEKAPSRTSSAVPRQLSSPGDEGQEASSSGSHSPRPDEEYAESESAPETSSIRESEVPLLIPSRPQSFKPMAPEIRVPANVTVDLDECAPRGLTFLLEGEDDLPALPLKGLRQNTEETLQGLNPVSTTRRRVQIAVGDRDDLDDRRSFGAFSRDHYRELLRTTDTMDSFIMNNILDNDAKEVQRKHLRMALEKRRNQHWLVSQELRINEALKFVQIGQSARNSRPPWKSPRQGLRFGRPGLPPSAAAQAVVPPQPTKSVSTEAGFPHPRQPVTLEEERGTERLSLATFIGNTSAGRGTMVDIEVQEGHEIETLRGTARRLVSYSEESPPAEEGLSMPTFEDIGTLDFLARQHEILEAKAAAGPIPEPELAENSNAD